MAQSKDETVGAAALGELLNYIFGLSTPEQVARHSPNCAGLLAGFRAANPNASFAVNGAIQRKVKPPVDPRPLTNAIWEGREDASETPAMRERKRLTEQKRKQDERKGLIPKREPKPAEPTKAQVLAQWRAAQ